jgi:hypothetical protein
MSVFAAVLNTKTSTNRYFRNAAQNYSCSAQGKGSGKFIQQLHRVVPNYFSFVIPTNLSHVVISLISC